MKRRKRRASIIIWTILVAGVRALYVFLNWNMVTDYYGYYERAMIRAEESTPLLSSGLVYAYTNVLSKLLSLCGNHLEAVLVFQGILQMAALYCFLCAMWCLCGRQAALLSATILAAIPSVVIAIANVEPISFYLFHFSLIFLMIGLFYTLSGEKGWRRSSICELYLMLMGLYLGVVCIWNYAGFLLVILFVGVLVKTHLVTKELIWRQDQKLLEEKDQIMSTFSKALIVFSGMLLGMLATLMKYTGISGEVISGQIRWWIGQFRDLPGICQGLEMKYVIYIIAVIVSGMLCNISQTCYKKHREKVRASGQEKQNHRRQKEGQKEKHQNQEQLKQNGGQPTDKTENQGEIKNPEKTKKKNASEGVKIFKIPEDAETAKKVEVKKATENIAEEQKASVPVQDIQEKTETEPEEQSVRETQVNEQLEIEELKMNLWKEELQREKFSTKPEDWRFDLDDSDEDWRFQDELQEEDKQPEKSDFFVTPDGRKVKYLMNPLPGPKKHVSRSLDFDFEVNMDDMLAFDQKPDEIEEWERKDR